MTYVSPGGGGGGGGVGGGVLSKYKTCGGKGYSQSIRQAQCVFFQWPPYTSA